MGKEKKPKLGIKTSRYYTKRCDNCGSEYPNWFTNCPSCGAAWDSSIEIQKTGETQKKNVKIVVKITEEDFDENIHKVTLVFSADQGKNWYQLNMDNKLDYYITEIAEVPVDSVIIYFIKVVLENGDTFIENNDGNYFYYKVGTSIEDSQKTAEDIKKDTPENLNSYQPGPLDKMELKKGSKDEDLKKNLTILGKPQTQIDPDLKICPHCSAKIKKMWSTCPICGGHVD